jgi:hypothetical protein
LIGGIDLLVDGRRGHPGRQQGRRLGDGGLHVLGGRVDAASQGERDGDLGTPSALVDVIESMPAIVVNCRSSGVATAEAIVSGLAPGNDAVTWMVGKSTLGRSLTGSFWYAITPKMTMAAMSSVVRTGRRMKSRCSRLGA